MKTKSVPSSWIRRWGLRLDCGPYLSGAVDARVKMESPRLRAQKLREVTTGIFHAGRESRTWVNDPKYGVPFLSSSDILKADLTDLPLLSKRQVERNPGFLIRNKWTLITRSGTIGRMVYVRTDMDGMACSEHAMRVVPDEKKIPPGYLSAFLRCKFGVPMVIGGTYGSIIQSIEPEHIADLPVPRLGESIERRAHELVEKAGQLRAEAASVLSQGIDALLNAADLPDLQHPESPYPFSVRSVASRRLGARFDAFFHGNYHHEALKEIHSCQSGYTTVGELSSSVVEPTRFKRTRIDDERYGIPFFGTSALFWSEPAPIYMIPKSLTGIEQYVIHRRTLLVPRSGQISGIIGRVILPYGDILDGAVTEDAIRINCPNENTAGYLFVALSSSYGVRQLKARAYGSSIPQQ